MTEPVVPRIPAALAHLPVAAGLVVPWITPHAADGRPTLGVIDADRQHSCLTERRCQVCAEPLGEVFVLLARTGDLSRRRVAEPPMHPVCADYTARACPMVVSREFAITEVLTRSNSRVVGHSGPS